MKYSVIKCTVMQKSPPHPVVSSVVLYASFRRSPDYPSPDPLDLNGPCSVINYQY